MRLSSHPPETDPLLVEPEKCFVVYNGPARFPLAKGVEAVSLADLCHELDTMR